MELVQNPAIEADDLPEPPTGLSARAVIVWHDYLADLAEDDLEPDPAEVVLLHDACRSVTLADRLEAALDAAGGFTVAGARGTERPHPLLLELDRARRTTATLLKALTASDKASTQKAAAGRAGMASRWAR